MSSFRFRYQRVLELRQTQLETAQRRLETLQSEVAQLRAQIELARSSMGFQANGAVTGLDLAVFASFRDKLDRDVVRMSTREAACVQEIAQQRARVLRARRSVDLLDKLKDRSRQDWKYASDRAEEAAAGESYLSRWARASD